MLPHHTLQSQPLSLVNLCDNLGNVCAGEPNSLNKPHFPLGLGGCPPPPLAAPNDLPAIGVIFFCVADQVGDSSRGGRHVGVGIK